MDFASPELNATRSRLQARFGEPVEAWWEQLPMSVAGLAERWGLVIDNAVGRGNTSLVLRCRRVDGRPAVLKLTPNGRLVAAEAAALHAWEPCGRAPLVWAHDAGIGALLLEAIPHEATLSEAGPSIALDQIACLIGSLHRTDPPDIADGIVTLADRVDFIFDYWLDRHQRLSGVKRVVPFGRLKRGQDLARELAADLEPAVLLHGDLHPGNVLDGGVARGLVAIDPRPCVGDGAFDAVDWVFWRDEDPRAWEPRSRKLAAALGVDHERLWTWCAALAALLASSRAARGTPGEEVASLLALGP